MRDDPVVNESNADEVSNLLAMLGEVSDAWEGPVPFDDVCIPDFPTEKLPGPLEAMVECLAESTQTPEEMAGLLSLGVLSTAFQSRYEVEIRDDWRETLNLYCVAVAPPGERKSAVISALTRPLYEYQRQRVESEAVAIAQNRAEYEMLEGALQTAKATAAKGKRDAEAAHQRALDLEAEKTTFQRLNEFRLMVDDCTPEKLISLMKEQKGCITACSSEGGIFDAMKGRYEKSINLDIYLKAHVGDYLTVDRVGRKRDEIAHPRLTMILTIQPDVLTGIMNNPDFRGRGLCGRFLYAMCKSKVGYRKADPLPVPDDVRLEYRAFVMRALSEQTKGIVRLSAGAQALRSSYHDHVEKMLRGEWATMRDWGGKLVGTMIRIAALFHCAETEGDPTQTPISAETMEAAISIADCLSANAEAAYQVMGADPDVENAKYILKRLTGERDITRSALTRLCRGKFKKAEDMDPALSILEDHGYIRTSTNAVGYNNRKQVAYKVNPALWRK